MNQGFILIISFVLGSICWSLMSIAAHLRAISRKLDKPKFEFSLKETELPPQLGNELLKIAWKAGQNFKMGAK